MIKNSFSLSKITEAVLPYSIISRHRERRDWRNWIGKLEANLFDDLTHAPDEIKRGLFKKYISLNLKIFQKLILRLRTKKQ